MSHKRKPKVEWGGKQKLAIFTPTEMSLSRQQWQLADRTVSEPLGTASGSAHPGLRTPKLQPIFPDGQPLAGDAGSKGKPFCLHGLQTWIALSLLFHRKIERKTFNKLEVCLGRKFVFLHSDLI